MSAVSRTIYILRNNNKDIGEASSIPELQKIHDILGDSIVKSIRGRRPLQKELMSSFVVKKCVDEHGMYIVGAETTQPSSALLINKHDDFIQYLLTYSRDLYSDRQTNLSAANTLLGAIEKKRELSGQIERFQKGWFNDQVAISKATGIPLVISHYPVCDASVELTDLITNAGDALQMLERKSLLFVENPLVPPLHVGL